MIYTPGQVPPDPSEIPAYLQGELLSLAQQIGVGQQYELLDKQYAPPAKLRDGMVVLADGTTWNPGSGAGFYGYYGAAWHFLGGGTITVQDEGVALATAAATLDFTGAGVTASGVGGTKTINIPGGGSGLDLVSYTFFGGL